MLIFFNKSLDFELFFGYNKSMIEEIARYHVVHDYITTPLSFGEINLIQIGRRFCEPGTGIKPHTHINWFELTIITSGQGTISTNGEECSVKSGEIHLAFPYEVHDIRADKNVKLEYDCISFFPNSSPYKENFKDIAITHRSANRRVFRDEKVSSLIANAISEFSVNKIFFKQIINGILLQVLAYTVRSFNDVQSKTADVTETQILCLQIMNYIDTHIYSLTNLAELTTKFNYNYNYLSSLFKKTTDKTLAEYMRNRKLEIAKVLILENKKKIGEIAEILNYSSIFSFSKAFKSKFGLSPDNYVKHLK